MHTLTLDELLHMLDEDDGLYDPARFAHIARIPLMNGHDLDGVFKAFSYGNSLRFHLLFRQSPSDESIRLALNKLAQIAQEYPKDTRLLCYSQIQGFSTALLDRLPGCTHPHHFYCYRVKREAVDTAVELRGLVSRKCTADMIDACIEVLEEVFTPHPDAPGSFLRDKDRITANFLDESGGAILFFKNDALVGFCGHKRGHITETAVRKAYQGQGYGEVIVRSTLKSIAEAGHDAKLTVDHDNHRAIALYENVGFTRGYESMRVTLSR